MPLAYSASYEDGVVTVTAEGAEDLRIMLWAKRLDTVTDAKDAYVKDPDIQDTTQPMVFSSRLTDLVEQGALTYTHENDVFTLTLTEALMGVLRDKDGYDGETTWIITPVAEAGGAPIPEFNTWEGERVDDTFFVYILEEFQLVEVDRQRLRTAIDSIEAIIDDGVNRWWDDEPLKLKELLIAKLAAANSVVDTAETQDELDNALDELMVSAFVAARQKLGPVAVVPLFAGIYDLDAFLDLDDEQKTTEESIYFINMERLKEMTFDTSGTKDIPMTVIYEQSVDGISTIIDAGITKYLATLDAINNASDKDEMKSVMEAFIDYAIEVYGSWEAAKARVNELSYFAQDASNDADYEVNDSFAETVYNQRPAEGYQTIGQAIFTGLQPGA